MILNQYLHVQHFGAAWRWHRNVTQTSPIITYVISLIYSHW